MIQKFATPALLAATVLPAPALAKSAVSKSQVCKVLEAAYGTATESTSPAYPLNLRLSDRVLELPNFVPHYKRQLNLAAGEFEDLERNAGAAPSVGYRPICAPSVKPTEFRMDDGTLLFASFSTDLFDRRRARDGRGFVQDGEDIRLRIDLHRPSPSGELVRDVPCQLDHLTPSANPRP